MIVCSQCQTSNSVDSKFCKSCGGAIAEVVQQEAHAKFDELLSGGHGLLNEGRAEEALMVAEKALEEQPDSLAATSLRAMALERAGKLPEALAAYERVCELNPDSALDKIKVQHLRQSLVLVVQEDAPAARRRAMVGAVAAILLVVSAGAAVALLNQNGTGKPTASHSTKSDTLPISSFAEGNLNAASTNPQPTGSTNPNVNLQPGDVPAVQDGQIQTQNPQNPALTPNSGGTLPRPQNWDGRQLPLAGGPDYRPVQPTGPIGQNPPPNVQLQPDGTGRQDPDPRVDPDPQTSNRTPEKPADQGTIEIKVRDPKKPTMGGSEPIDGGSANEATALMRTANQQFQLGQYDRSVRTYEAAVRAGADGATAYQRIGQANSNLGKKSEAISAYRRAIGILESAVASGRGNKARNEKALDTCRQAIKVLGG